LYGIDFFEGKFSDMRKSVKLFTTFFKKELIHAIAGLWLPFLWSDITNKSL
jgi:hypothetical protein